jgi:hypothetical protein
MAENKLHQLGTFGSLDELVGYFDSHDMGEYENCLPEAQFEVDLRSKNRPLASDQATVTNEYSPFEFAPPTVRKRLEDYQFSDEQELTLTLELLNRIEKDIHDLKQTNPRQGFSLYVVMAGIATTAYIMLGELSKLSTISFSDIGAIFFASVLMLKIPWAFNQIIMFDRRPRMNHQPGRFFWSNDFLFENRPGGTFQAIVFSICVIGIFFLSVPLWITFFTAISFLLYIFIIGLLVVFSFKKKAFNPTTTNKKVIIGLPLLFIITTIVSVYGLILHIRLPIGSQTQPYIIAGLLLTIFFFVDTLIRLWTPSVLVEKLEILRYDIIFLKTDLKDAWVRYDMHVKGSDISEEIREDMENVIRSLNSVDYHQSQKLQALSVIKQEAERLQNLSELTEADFETINQMKVVFFAHHEGMSRIDQHLDSQLKNLADQIQEISRATQEWERANQYHNFIKARLEKIDKNQEETAKQAKVADQTIAILRPAIREKNMN